MAQLFTMALNTMATTNALSGIWLSSTGIASQSLQTATPTLLAFETLPSLEEAQAIGEALMEWPDLAAWFTFTCPDTQAARLQVAHGESLRNCATLSASFPQTIAVDINCTQPIWIASLIVELRQASSKPIVVYPNSGEGWDAETRCWTGSSDHVVFGEHARQWFDCGAQLVGGCCHTRPEHIRQLAEAAATL
jgi:homocysteine S-methyltransferase